VDLEKKRVKIDRIVRQILKKHRECDEKENDGDIRKREKRHLKTLRKASRKIRKFLSETEEKLGGSGKEVQSNVTDKESAKMKTSHGVIQGYIGVAGVDAKHQVIVHAQAHGEAQEHHLLKPAVEGLRAVVEQSGSKEQSLDGAKVIADSGYHTLKNMDYLEKEKLDGYVADKAYRSRDERFLTAARHRPQTKTGKRYTVEKFDYDLAKKTCRCPAGNSMWLRCKRARIGNYWFMQFQAHKADCESCPERSVCLRKETQKTPRLVNIRLDKTKESKTSAIERMKRKIDSDRGRYIYSFRLGIVEPVFGNISHAIGIKRFSLRSERKVNGQWKLMSLIHNLAKIHRYGWSSA